MSFSSKIGPTILLPIVALLICFASLTGAFRRGTENPVRRIETGMHFDAVAVSAAGLLASGTLVEPSANPAPYLISIWNLETGRLLNKWRTEDAFDLALSSDGTTLVSRGQKGALLWQVSDGSLVRRFTVGDEQVIKIALSPDNEFLAAAGSSKIWLWQLSSGQLKSTFDTNGDEPYSLAFSRNGKLLAVGTGQTNKAEIPDNRFYPIFVFETTSGKLASKLAGHQSEVSCVDFNAYGTRLVSGSAFNGDLREWSVGDQSLLNRFPTSINLMKRLSGYHASVSACAFSPDGKFIVFGDANNSLNLIPADSREDPKSLFQDTARSLKVVIDSGTGNLYSVNSKGEVVTMDFTSAVSKK